MSAGGRSQRRRQRGHGSPQALVWLVALMPFFVAFLGAGFVGLLVWAIWRLCKT